MESIPKCTLNNVPCEEVRITFTAQGFNSFQQFGVKSWKGEARFHDFEYMCEALRDWLTVPAIIETEELKGNAWITYYNPQFFVIKFDGSGKPTFKK